MNKNMYTRYSILPGLAALAVLLSVGCAKEDAVREVMPVAVRTAVVEPSPITESLQFTGNLESPLSVQITSKTQGRVVKMEGKKGRPLQEGDIVKKGAVMAEIEHDELEAQVALAEAQLQLAQVTLADRERERRRMETLFAEEVSTEQARDAAVTAHESAKASLAQAEAQLRLAKVNLDEAYIRSPMDGVVAERYVDPGAMVGVNTPIFQLVQMNPIRLMLAIPARLAPLMVPKKTQLTLKANGSRSFDCVVNRIFPTADSNSRTVRVEVLLDNEQTEAGTWILRPGMYATADINLAVRDDSLTIPASSIIRVLDRQIVYVVDGDTARAVDVQTGIRYGDLVEVVSGMAAGDEYVVMGQNKLTDGVRVERVDAAAAAE